MCFYMRAGVNGAGNFSSMTEKIKAKTTVPVILTGSLRRAEDAERLLKEGKADLIGVGRALLKDPCRRG